VATGAIISLRSKLCGHKVNHSHPANVKVKNSWSCTSCTYSSMGTALLFSYITLHSLDPELVKMTVEGGICHKKGKAIPVTGHEGAWGCEMSKLTHFLDSWLTDVSHAASSLLQVCVEGRHPASPFITPPPPSSRHAAVSVPLPFSSVSCDPPPPPCPGEGYCSSGKMRAVPFRQLLTGSRSKLVGKAVFLGRRRMGK
jgi:hypothetical protein